MPGESARNQEISAIGTCHPSQPEKARKPPVPPGTRAGHEAKKRREAMRDEFAQRANPLRLFPEGQARRHKVAGRKAARGNFRAAVKLFCVECLGHSEADASTCDTTGCPLWAANRRIFAKPPKPASDAELARERENGRS